jgi:hypothetical protein
VTTTTGPESRRYPIAGVAWGARPVWRRGERHPGGSSDRAGAVDAGVGARTTEIAAAAVGVTGTWSSRSGKAGALVAIAKAALGIAGAGGAAVAAAATEPAGAIETAATGAVAAARPAPARGAGAIPDEEVA